MTERVGHKSIFHAKTPIQPPALPWPCTRWITPKNSEIDRSDNLGNRTVEIANALRSRNDGTQEERMARKTVLASDVSGKNMGR